MPELDLHDLDERIQLLNITAIMCFPSEKNLKKRLYWQLRSLLRIAAEEYIYFSNKTPVEEKEASIFIGRWLGETIYELGGWGALANATVGPGQKKSPVKEVNDTLKLGIITGWVLTDILYNGGGVSSSAKRFCSEKTDKIFREKNMKPLNENCNNIINKIWPRFKNAAHLWAAFLDNKKIVPSRKHSFLALEQFEPGGLKGFLSLADYYRQKGEQHIPSPGPRKPLLDKKTIWQISL